MTEKIVTKNIILYHGCISYDFVVSPAYYTSNRDFGQGLYLTQSKVRAKEWAVDHLRIMTDRCWLHTFVLQAGSLRVLDFTQMDVRYWIAEVLRHRSPYGMDDVLGFVTEYTLNTSNYDVVRGWSAGNVYFQIILEYLRGNLSLDNVSLALNSDIWDIQYCIKSPRAFRCLYRRSVERVNKDFNLKGPQSVRRTVYELLKSLSTTTDVG